MLNFLEELELVYHRVKSRNHVTHTFVVRREVVTPMAVKSNWESIQDSNSPAMNIDVFSWSHARGILLINTVPTGKRFYQMFIGRGRGDYSQNQINIKDKKLCN